MKSAPFQWQQRAGDCSWPYEVHHGGLHFLIRHMGTDKGRPVYCIQVEVGRQGLFKFAGLKSVKHLRLMSKREVYARLRRTCRLCRCDFEKDRPPPTKVMS